MDKLIDDWPYKPMLNTFMEGTTAKLATIISDYFYVGTYA